MPARKKKVDTFDGPTFWKNAYADKRALLLRMIDTPEDSIKDMTSMSYLDLPLDTRYYPDGLSCALFSIMSYLDLPLDTRYDIETSPDVDRSRLA